MSLLSSLIKEKSRRNKVDDARKRGVKDAFAAGLKGDLDVTETPGESLKRALPGVNLTTKNPLGSGHTGQGRATEIRKLRKLAMPMASAQRVGDIFAYNAAYRKARPYIAKTQGKKLAKEMPDEAQLRLDSKRIGQRRKNMGRRSTFLSQLGII